MRRRSVRLSLAGVSSSSDSLDIVDHFNTRFTLISFLKKSRRLTDEQKKAIKKAGFGTLLLIPDQSLNKKLLLELMRRWDPKKHSFALPCGDINLTLKDMALTLGLRVVGVPAVFDDEDSFLEIERWYGAAVWKRSVTVASVENRLDSLGEICNDDFVRTFLLYTFGNFLFPNVDGKVDTRYLSLLKNVDKICSYAWGQAVLEHLIKWLDKRKEVDAIYVGGCLLFLQIWSFEHIDIARPALLEICAPFPRVCQWAKIESSKEQLSLKFKDLQNHEVTWELQPTSLESEVDVIKELLETQSKEKEISEAESSYANFADDNDLERRRLFRSHDVIQLETESESSGGSDVQSKIEVNLDSPDVSHHCSTPLSLSKFQKQQNQVAVYEDLVTPIADEDERPRMQVLEEQNIQLKEKLQESEEYIAILKTEIEDLKIKNKLLSVSSNDFVERMEKILSDDISADEVSQPTQESDPETAKASASQILSDSL